MTKTSRIVIPGLRSQNRKSLGLVALAITFMLCGMMADAQQPAGKIPRIGIISHTVVSDRESALLDDEFKKGLRDLGYVEGQDLR